MQVDLTLELSRRSIRPLVATGLRSTTGWKYSETAASYYWARWKADRPDKSVIPLPQANWGDPD
jgi:hypothetical protein